MMMINKNGVSRIYYVGAHLESSIMNFLETSYRLKNKEMLGASQNDNAIANRQFFNPVANKSSQGPLPMGATVPATGNSLIISAETQMRNEQFSTTKGSLHLGTRAKQAAQTSNGRVDDIVYSFK
jgi:hypothetical protein